jgi:hypothetical protein
MIEPHNPDDINRNETWKDEGTVAWDSKLVVCKRQNHHHITYCKILTDSQIGLFCDPFIRFAGILCFEFVHL